MEKLMKLVSTNTRYGGPSCVLYWKNNADDACSLNDKSKEQWLQQSLYIIWMEVNIKIPNQFSFTEVFGIS